MTKQEQYELLMDCYDGYMKLLQKLFKTQTLNEEDMDIVISVQDAFWTIARSLVKEIRSEGK